MKTIDLLLETINVDITSDMSRYASYAKEYILDLYQDRADRDNEELNLKEAEALIRELVDKTQINLEKFSQKIKSSFNVIEGNWTGSNILITVSYLKGLDFSLYAADDFSVKVYKEDNRYAPDFTVFNMGQQIDDILDAGDTDFFVNADVENDYFLLVNLLKNPEVFSDPDRALWLYTARPKADRHIYDRDNKIPSNIFLTTDAEEAFGYAREYSDRDVYKMKIRQRYLTQTLDVPGKKNFQTISKTGWVPVETSERLTEAKFNAKNSAAKRFVNEIKRVNFHRIRIKFDVLNRNTVELAQFYAEDPGMGAGSLAMDIITSTADKHRVSIELIMDSESDIEALERFYSNFDFVETNIYSMIRKPQSLNEVFVQTQSKLTIDDNQTAKILTMNQIDTIDNFILVDGIYDKYRILALHDNTELISAIFISTHQRSQYPCLSIVWTNPAHRSNNYSSQIIYYAVKTLKIKPLLSDDIMSPEAIGSFHKLIDSSDLKLSVWDQDTHTVIPYSKSEKVYNDLYSLIQNKTIPNQGANEKQGDRYIWLIESWRSDEEKYRYLHGVGILAPWRRALCTEQENKEYSKTLTTREFKLIRLNESPKNDWVFGAYYITTQIEAEKIREKEFEHEVKKGPLGKGIYFTGEEFTPFESLDRIVIQIRVEMNNPLIVRVKSKEELIKIVKQTNFKTDKYDGVLWLDPITDKLKRGLAFRASNVYYERNPYDLFEEQLVEKVIKLTSYDNRRFMVLVNPTVQQIKQLFISTAPSEVPYESLSPLRGLLDFSTGKFYVWYGYMAIHSEAIRKLGLDGDFSIHFSIWSDMSFEYQEPSYVTGMGLKEIDPDILNSKNMNTYLKHLPGFKLPISESRDPYREYEISYEEFMERLTPSAKIFLDKQFEEDYNYTKNLADKIKEEGWDNKPLILIPEVSGQFSIFDGNHRINAIRKFGIEVPYIRYRLTSPRRPLKKRHNPAYDKRV